jgi:hypothetical protein
MSAGYTSSERQILRDKQGNISQLVETRTDRNGKRTRVVKTTVRDDKGDMVAINETVEDAGWSEEAIEAQRRRVNAMFDPSRRRERDAMELSRTSDGAYKTKTRSGR